MILQARCKWCLEMRRFDVDSVGDVVPRADAPRCPVAQNGVCLPESKGDRMTREGFAAAGKKYRYATRKR